MTYTLSARRTFIFVVVAIAVLLAALACLMLLISRHIYLWHVVGAVPWIIYPHS